MSQETGGTHKQVPGTAIQPMDVVDELREQMAQLRAVVEQQQIRMEQQDVELAALRAASRGDGDRASGTIRAATSKQTRVRASSRRALLKWGGAAAAATTVALMASEGQSAWAHPASDGNNLQLGAVGTSNNTASTATYLTAVSGATPSTLLVVDASAASGKNGAIVAHGVGGGFGVVGESDTGNGVKGQLLSASIGGNGSTAGVFGSGNPGVYAASKNSDGVDAFGADNANGVYASVGGTVGNGVQAFASGLNGYAVWGRSDTGYGVVGEVATGIDVSVGGGTGQGRLVQKLQAGAGSPSGGTYIAGEQIRDQNGEMWLCVASGSPGIWVRAAHVPDGYTGGGIAYLSKPIRLLDTRAGDGNAWKNPGSPYAGGSMNTLQVAGVSWQGVDVPSTAVGAIGKVTVISGTGGSGYVALAPAGSGTPTTGTLPYGANATLATSFNVGLGGSPGSLEIYVGGTTIDVVIDLFAVVA